MLGSFFRYNRWFLVLGVCWALAACLNSTATIAPERSAGTIAEKTLEDPFLWLEQIEGNQALAWVQEQNKRSETVFFHDQRFATFLAEATAIFNSDARIPYGELQGGHVYNFWQDANNVRGVWRRATLESYKTEEPDWQILLDVDALAAADGESWVFKGADCLPPDFERCMVRLSRGGADAALQREFDIRSQSFVKNGFSLPEAKSQAIWLNADQLLVATDFGEGSLTASGYPRIVKMWDRGKPLADATTVFEGETTDVGLRMDANHNPRGATPIIRRGLTFFDAEFYVDRGNEVVKIPLPGRVFLAGLINGRVIAILQQDWEYAGNSYPQGVVIAYELETGSAEIVYAPKEREAVRRVSIGSTSIVIQVLDNVTGKVKRMIRGDAGWTATSVALPDNGVVTVGTFDAFGDGGMARFNSPIAPDSLFYISESGDTEIIKQLPHLFDASNVIVEQREAISKDGTKVPYFVVGKADALAAESAPTYLYGYGGFASSQLPQYSATVGKLWLERGGVFAIANIRGGGEFGPAWHQAALTTSRQNSYDDFYAVAEALIATGVTSPRQLGISGTSNGGLLMGVALTQCPDLFNAVAAIVPLLDMMRYHKLLAGASWVAEYGNPDIAAERDYLLTYSPYQNVRPEGDYPVPLFYTSTKDDRVHPGHARKMAARMMAQGHSAFFYENMEGGHAGAANQNQRAVRTALLYTYFARQLFDNEPAP